MMINGSYQLSEMLRFFITVMDLTMEMGRYPPNFGLSWNFAGIQLPFSVLCGPCNWDP